MSDREETNVFEDSLEESWREKKAPKLSDIQNIFKHFGLLGEEKNSSLLTLAFSSGLSLGIISLAGSGKCVNYSTEVYFFDGTKKKIGDIIKGEKENREIISLNEKTLKLEKKRIINYASNGQKDVFSLLTKHVGNEIVTTDNHMFFTDSGWKELKDLKEGDYIALPRILPVENEKISLSKDKIKLLAYWIAEGTRAAPEITNIKKQIQKEIIKCVSSLDCVGENKGKKIYIKRKKRNNDINDFQKLLIKLNLFGKYSKERFIPEIVKKASKKQKALFLNRMFSCDGYIDKNYNISITSSSKKLIKDIQDILLQFGIISFHKKNISSYYNKKYGEKRYFKNNDLFIYGINAYKYLTYIGFYGVPLKKQRMRRGLKHYKSIKFNTNTDLIPDKLLKYKYSKSGKTKSILINGKNIWSKQNKQISRASLKKFNEGSLCSKTIKQLYDNDIFWDKIKEIKYVGKEETFDIEIEDNHNFIANGFIVHNSMMADVFFDELFPKDLVYKTGSTSKTALIYAHHKINASKGLYITELQKILDSSDLNLELMKTLLEGKQFTRPVTNAAIRGNIEYKINPIPICFTIATENTHKEYTEEEFCRRGFLYLTTNISKELTADVIKHKLRKRFKKKRLSKIEANTLKETQEHIRNLTMFRDKYTFENPFSEYFIDIIPSDYLRVRSILDNYLNIMECSAKWFLNNRISTNEENKIFIELQDIYNAFCLYNETFYNTLLQIPVLGKTILEVFKEGKGAKKKDNQASLIEYEDTLEFDRKMMTVEMIHRELQKKKITLTHTVINNTCNQLCHGNYLEKERIGTKIFYIKTFDMEKIDKKLDIKKCFETGYKLMKKEYPEYVDKWLNSQIDEEGNIYVVDPISNENILITSVFQLDENALKNTSTSDPSINEKPPIVDANTPQEEIKIGKNDELYLLEKYGEKAIEVLEASGEIILDKEKRIYKIME